MGAQILVFVNNFLSLEVQKTKEVKGLANFLIHEVVNKLSASDTLYIAVEKQYSICGNDEHLMVQWLLLLK
ncbi:hypothetical protein PG630_03085 [Riemerella anatipestifer]|nr:hypothetical protein [Riemerella anatipestifer]